MPDNVRVTSVNDSTVINEISFCIYQAIIFIQQQQPRLLTEKYRNVPWSDAPYQSSFLLKLQTELNKAPDKDALIKTVRKLLQLILTPQCLELPISTKLIEKLRILIDSASERDSRNGSAFSHPAEAPRVLIPEQHIAILLLDAENLQLDTETEKFLTTVCTYFIQVKIAFANWRRMGKLDAELHERGYDLIHVPAGRDNADGKMIAVGLSIREHYPKVKEVLVCSSDTVMTNLCNHLQKYGLTVYRVFRHGSNITVSNYQTGEIETYTSKYLPVIPPLMQCISYLKLLL
ncbi:MAG: NYN domain-containing protein, partial [Cyanobacteriota bacterium]